VRNIDSASSPRAAVYSIRRRFGAISADLEIPESRLPRRSRRIIDFRSRYLFTRREKLRLARSTWRRVNLVSRLAAAIYSSIAAPGSESTRNSGCSSLPVPE